MKKSLLLIALVSILLQISVVAQVSNFDTEIFPLSKCSGGELMTLDVADTGLLTITMPTDIYYVQGSVTGASEISSSGNTAIFHVSTVGTITYKHSATCNVNELLSFFDEAVINGSASFPSASYNVAEASPQITQVLNSPTSANVGQTVTKTISITNGGIGKVSDWYYEDIFPTGDVQLVTGSFNLGSYTIPANQITLTSGGGFDTLRIHFTSTDMMQVGNLDIYLDGNDPSLGAPVQESFDFSYQVVPQNCGTGYAVNSEHATYFGCGSICSNITFASVLDLNIPTPPNLSFTSSNPLPTCQQGGSVARTLTITNTGGVAKNFLMNFGNFYGYSTNNGYSSWIDTASFKYSINGGPLQSPAFSEVKLNGASWEGNSICGDAVGKPTLFKFSIPFIPAGATVVVSYDFYTCCSSNSNCPAGNDANYRIYEEQVYIKDGKYNNACEDVLYNIGEQSLTYTGLSHTASLDYPSDIVNGETKTFKTPIYANWNNLTLSTGAYFEVNTVLPNGYVLQGSPIANAGLATWTGTTNQVGNTITTRFTLPVPNNFDINYFDYLMDLKLDCALRSGSDPTTIYQQHIFSQNPLCACTRQLVCMQNAPLIHCPGPCAEGIANEYCTAQRINFGEPDANNDGVADVGPYNFSQMATDRAFYGDTIEYTYGGKINWINTNGPFTNAYAESVLSNVSSVFTVLGADVSVYQNGSLVSGPTNFIPTVTGNTILTDFSSLVSSLNQGDSIVTHLRTKVVDNSLVQAQKEEVYTSLNKMFASRTPNPTEVSGDRKYCDRWGGTIRTVSFYYTVDARTPSLQGCNQAYLSNYEYFSVGVNGTSNYHQKSIRFPYEVRKHSYAERAVFLLPASYNYLVDSVNITYYRTSGYTSANFTKYSVPYTIHGDSILVDVKQYYQEFGGSNANPISDDGWLVETKLFVSADCHTRIPAGNVGMVWNMNSQNINHVNFDYDYGWTIAQGAKTIKSNPVQLVAAGAGIQNVQGRVFNYTNVVLSNQSSGASNVGYAFFELNAATQLTEVRLNGNLIFPNANGYYNLNGFSGGESKLLSIKGITSSCINDTFKMYYNWSCQQFPTALPNPSIECYPPLKFILKPLLAKIDGNITPLASTPLNTNGSGGLFGSQQISLCNPFPVEIVINSAIQGTIFDLLAHTKLPAGIEYVAGSAKYEHPIGSASVAMSSLQESQLIAAGAGGVLPFDIQLMSNNAIDSLQGTMSSTSNVRQIKIRFLAKATCNYAGTGRISTTLNAKRACGLNALNTGTVKGSSQIKLAPVGGMMPVTISSNIGTINGCGVSTNGSITVNKVDNTLPTLTDSIKLNFPLGLDINSVYCPSCSPSLGIPHATQDGTTKTLTWLFPQGNVNGSFSIQFNATANAQATCGVVQEISASVTQQKILTCGSSTCGAANTLEAANSNSSFAVNLPSLNISNLTATTYSSSAPFVYNTQVTIQNSTAVSSNGCKIVYAIDTDDDGLLSAGDALIGSEIISTVLAPGASLQWTKNFSSSTAANGHQFITAIYTNSTDPANSSCTCNDSYASAPVNIDLNIPKPNLTPFPNKQFCYGQNIILKATGLAGATFNWTTPNSCVGNIDNSIVGESTLLIQDMSATCNGKFYVSQTLNGSTSMVDSFILDAGPKPVINYVSTSCVGNMGQLVIQTTPSSSMQYALNGGAFQTSSTFTTDPGSTFVVQVKSNNSSCIAEYIGSCVYCANSATCANPPKDSLIAPSTACASAPISIEAHFWNASSLTWVSSGTGLFSNATCTSSPCQVSYMPSTADLLQGSVIIKGVTNDPDGSGPCIAASQAKLIKLVNGLVAPTVTNNGPICENSGLQLLAKGAVSTVQWTGPNGFTQSGDSIIITQATAQHNGLYIATASALGCSSVSSTTTATIVSAPALVVSVTPNPEACLNAGNGSIDVDVLGGSGQYNICYNGNLSNCVNGSSAHFSWIGAGNYTVTVVDAVCPNNILNYPVTVTTANPVPVPVVPATITLCAGETLTLNGSITYPATTINWTKNPGFNAIGNPLNLTNATPSMSGVYYAKALNAAGCASLQVPVNVIVGEKPVIQHVQVNCINNEAHMEVTATSNTGSLLFSIDGIQYQTSNIFNQVAPGSLTLYVKNSLTSCIETLPLSIINCACPTAPEIQVEASSVSCGLATIPVSVTSNVPTNATLTSTGSGNFVVNAGNTPLQTFYQPSSLDLQQGLAYVTATTDDPDGSGPCTPVSETILVLLKDSLQTPIITQNQSTYCAGDTLQLIASNTNSLIQWNGVGGFTKNGDTASIPAITQFLSGNYTATASGNACVSKSSTTTVQINAGPNLIVTTSSLPEGCAGQGNGSIHAEASGGSGTYRFCYTLYANCSMQTNQVDFKYLAPGTYTVYVSDSTCINKMSSNIVQVGSGKVVDPPTSASYNNPVCENEDLVLTSTGPSGGTYLWTDTKNNFVDTGAVITRSKAQTAMSGLYKLQRLDEGCASMPIWLDVKVFGKPNILSIDTFCLSNTHEDSGRIVIQAITNGNDALEYSLNNGAFQANPVFDQLTNGLYKLDVRTAGSDCITTMSDIELYCQCVCNKETNVSIFPNPNQGEFTLNVNLLEPSSDIAVTIYDFKGAKVYEKSLTATSGLLNQDIQLENYAAGIYMLRLKIDADVFIIPIHCY